MADLVSVAGTAIGVTSLGIQLCQTVIKYYSRFRSFDDDISAVVKRAEVLESTLEALESVRVKMDVRHGHVSKHLQSAMNACAVSMEALNAMAQKCGETALPHSSKDTRRILEKRLLWPFKQNTLTNLRTALDELQANVQLAVQVVDL
jgi:hypothetical protein